MLLATVVLPIYPACATQRGATSNQEPQASATDTEAATSTAPGILAAEPAPQPPMPTIEERAKILAHRFIVVDGHVDLPDRLYSGRNPDGTLRENVAERTSTGNFDFIRAREGGLDAPFMSIFVPSSYQQTGGAKAYADSLIDLVVDLTKHAPNHFGLARNVAEVKQQFQAGRIALPLGIENGAAIEKKLSNLAHFYDRGVRYITLTHATDNAISDSSYDRSHTHQGLSPFGEKVVVEMNRLGIMVDVSHISDQAFSDVIAISQTPVIASHSSCRHFVPGFERDMSDEMIQTLASHGGVIMVNFGSTFVSAKANAWAAEMRPQLNAWMAKNGVKDSHEPRAQAWEAHYRAEHPFPYATVAEVAAHIMHIIQLTGPDHVGLGSDFDGVGDSLPVGLKDPSQLPNLFAQLLERGLSDEEIEKLASGNIFRVWQAAEDYAASARGAR
jgi:membrane dipeptidase